MLVPLRRSRWFVAIPETKLKEAIPSRIAEYDERAGGLGVFHFFGHFGSLRLVPAVSALCGMPVLMIWKRRR